MIAEAARLRILLRAVRLDLADPGLPNHWRWIVERRQIHIEQRLVELLGPGALQA